MNRKIHAGFGPAVEGEAPRGNLWQAPHPTGMPIDCNRMCWPGLQRSAYLEAISHLSLALDLQKSLPETRERAQHELSLQVSLGVPLGATKGFAAPEVENVYLRARELCEQVGDTPELFPVLWGLWGFYVVRAEYKTLTGVSLEL